MTATNALAGVDFEALWSKLPARACVTDRNLRVVWDNGPAFPSDPSAVGKTVPELFADHPDRERVLDGCRRALEGESSRLDINSGVAAAHLLLEPLQDPAGTVTGVVGIAFDITEHARADLELRKMQGLLRQVLDALPVGVAVMDRAGDIMLHNPATNDIWGTLLMEGKQRYDRTRGYWHHTGALIAPEEWASRRAIRNGETSRNELIDIDTFDGGRKTIENFATPIRDPQGDIRGAVVVNQDVTKRVRAEEALGRTRQLLEEAEQLGGTGSWEQDLVTGAIINSAANHRLFFDEDASKGVRLEDYADVIHPDDRAWVIQRRRELLEGRGWPEIEYRVVRADGSIRWIFGRATVVRDEAGRAVRVYGVNIDITERKRAGEELARRAQLLETLSRKLIQAQEAERRAVARELHDDFGQVLTAIKLHLQRDRRDDAESIAMVDSAIARMRELAQDLRPPLLDEYGLEASLTWYVKREADRAGLAYGLRLARLEQRPPSSIETTCFRVTQEALTNIVRHAQAKLVEVEVGVVDGVLRVVVTDDGKGFDVAAARRRAEHGGSQGLLGMQERVALVGGRLEIDSAPGYGATVRAYLPLTSGHG